MALRESAGERLASVDGARIGLVDGRECRAQLRRYCVFAKRFEFGFGLKQSVLDQAILALWFGN